MVWEGEIIVVNEASVGDQQRMLPSEEMPQGWHHGNFAGGGAAQVTRGHRLSSLVPPESAGIPARVLACYSIETSNILSEVKLVFLPPNGCLVIYYMVIDM